MEYIYLTRGVSAEVGLPNFARKMTYQKSLAIP